MELLSHKAVCIQGLVTVLKCVLQLHIFSLSLCSVWSVFCVLTSKKIIGSGDYQPF